MFLQIGKVTVMVKKRYPLLDLLRWIAAIMVATLHWSLEIGPPNSNKILSIPIFGKLVANGGLGVTIFFIISGYVIIETAMKRDALDFIFARFNRLFPGLLICMPLVLIVGSRYIQSYPTPARSLFNSIFLTYKLTGAPPLTSQLWTLIIEVQFYGAVALLLFLFPKLFKSGRRILFLLVGWQLLLTALTSMHWFDSTQLSRYLDLSGYGSLFALGICLNILSNTKIRDLENFLPSSVLTFYFLSKEYGILGHGAAQETIIACAVLIIFFSRFVNFTSKRLSKYFQWLGLSSYLIYLIHLQVGMAFINEFRNHVSTNVYLIFLLAILFITFVSILISLFMEKPIQAFGTANFGKIRRIGKTKIAITG
jgi:peptidoglycan/LPS O-acetylase OafA/YrhL